MKKLYIPYLYLALVFAQLLHSAEEYFTGFFIYMTKNSHYLHQKTGIIPSLNVDAETFLIVNIIIVTVMFLISIFVFKENIFALKLVKIIALIEVLNGLGHNIMALLNFSYYSGCISSVLLFILGIMILRSNSEGFNN